MTILRNIRTLIKAFVSETHNYTFQKGADIGSITIHQLGRGSGQRERFN